MSHRQQNLVWLRDLLDHLSVCQQRMEWAEDNETVRLLSENMLNDLERCKRLCESIQRRCALQAQQV